MIGINGRGSFEKRGRVNVGVGYAISINQIKNFLGHLKSGRIVDHATLGANVASSSDGRVLVDDILDESDAFRRGLRYGDEVLSFGGREIRTVNGMKNVLGIFPKGWRVPLVYRHRGETFEVLVRLRGLHAEAELAEMIEMPGQPGPPPPGEPKPKDDAPRRSPHAAPAPMSELAKQHFVSKPGYINYYFNQLHRDRVWKAAVAAGEYAPLAGTAWTIIGTTPNGDPIELTAADKSAAIKLASGALSIELEGDLAARLDPPGSGGLLVSLALWRRLLVSGPEKFPELTYWGTAPLADREGLFDVLAGPYRDVDCRFYFDPADGRLAALEMLPEEDTDPCELYFSDYREVEGRQFPHRIEVRHGDNVYQVVDVNEYRFADPAESK